jgi:cytochrome c553
MKKIILSSIVAVAIFAGCGENKKADDKSIEVTEKVVKTEEKTPETKFVDQVKNSATEVGNKIVEESKKVVDAGSEAAQSVGDKVATKTQEIKDEAVKMASNTQDKIEKSIDEIVATKSDTDNKAKGLFLKCAGCHGQTAEKQALGKSQIIKGWSKDQIVSALKGYKEGTYGGAMKGVMKSQVLNLSDEDIDALGSYISSF